MRYYTAIFQLKCNARFTSLEGSHKNQADSVDGFHL